MMNPRMPTKEQILEALTPIQDPEIRIGIVDLGLIYKVEIGPGGDVAIDMTLTAMGCPYGETLAARVRDVVQKLDGVATVKVNIVWEPVWRPDERCSDKAKDELGMW